jgi:undecaprenyl-diphosphatase
MDLLHFFQILLLAIVQGAAELLPISSSAHVTIAARLIGYDMKQVYEWTFLLVMLHTGTMFSVLIYFWPRWKRLRAAVPALIVATVATAAVGYPLKHVVEKVFLNHDASAQPQEIEQLFLNLPLMACSLSLVGILIIVAGIKDERLPSKSESIDLKRAAAIGCIQGLALPFRGFSRSGSTISTGMLLGIGRMTAEEFSFALAVIITPAVIAREALMLVKEHSQSASGAVSIGQLMLPGVVGMAASCAAGLLALRWLSSWLEKGRWKFFGFYCLLAAAAVLAIHFGGVMSAV